MVLSYWPSHRTISCTCFTESYWAGPQGDFTSKSYNFWPLSGVRYGLGRKAEAFLATSKVWSVSIWRQDKVKHPWSLWTLSADSFKCDWSLSYVSKATSNAGNGPPGLTHTPKTLYCHSSLSQCLLNRETQLSAGGAAQASEVQPVDAPHSSWEGSWLGWVFHGQTTSPAARHPDCWHSSAMQSIIRFASTMLQFSICATKLLESSRKS